MSRILVIDDERSLRNTIKDILEFENYEVICAESGQDGLNEILAGEFDLVLCDIKMPKMDGVEVLDKIINEHKLDIPVIMISGHGELETAIQVLKNGAFDYIQKPLDLNRLLVTVRNGLQHEKLVKETTVLRKKVNSKYVMVGESEGIKDVREIIDKIAPTNARVLITGENGTGKEIVARLIHEASNRRKKPFVEVNCAAIPPELIESELFGHEKGSFTSAIKQRIGKFEQAHEGTLFLDEIGDMSLSAQAKVLRVLQESKLTRVGGDKQHQVDVRVLAATNKNVEELIAKGEFREDLYHRINVIPIKLPSLKERKEDIPLLIKHFLKQLTSEQSLPNKTMDKSAIKLLQDQPWTGNIRELRNVIERLIILTDSNISREDIKKYV